MAIPRAQREYRSRYVPSFAQAENAPSNDEAGPVPHKDLHRGYEAEDDDLGTDVYSRPDALQDHV